MKPSVAIIGFGRFGQLVASILKQDFDLCVVNHHVHDTVVVNQLGARLIDFNEIESMHTIILCMPIGKIREIVDLIASIIQPNTIVMDTCSVKIYPLEQMIQGLNADIVATHPLFGPDSYTGSFSNQQIVMCTDTKKGSAGYVFWYKYFQKGGAEIIEMSADEHDKQAAYTQGLTHLIGRIVGGMDVPTARVQTKGSRVIADIVTQTTNDSWRLFDELMRYNPYSAAMRDTFETSHDQIKKHLDNLLE